MVAKHSVKEFIETFEEERERLNQGLKEVFNSL